MAVPLSFSIPDKFKKGADVPFKIRNAENFDTIEIEGPKGGTKKIIGSYLKDNSFSDTIKGVLKNAKKSRYTAVGYGARVNAGNRLVYDKKLVETVSNAAQVISNMSNNNSNGSGSENAKNLVKKYGKYAVPAAAAAGLLYYLIGE
ncbi:MAG: hypothetical protein ABEJ98_05200 [Candidatus Nanohaloarchaea archaeon]